MRKLLNSLFAPLLYGYLIGEGIIMVWDISPIRTGDEIMILSSVVILYVNRIINQHYKS